MDKLVQNIFAQKNEITSLKFQLDKLSAENDQLHQEMSGMVGQLLQTSFVEQFSNDSLIAFANSKACDAFQLFVLLP
jgi:hypothetical protein